MNIENENSLKKEYKTLYNLNHLCPVCGEIFNVVYCSPICDELAQDWGLTEEQKRFFNYREGCLCKHCGSNTRSRNFAKTILEIINFKMNLNIQFLKDISNEKSLDALHVAEINSCGSLHPFLTGFKNLYYSEYNSPFDDIPSEDLLNLSYEDNLFDIVLMTDVLEHIPNYKRALSQVMRVLKDDGHFIFTVPLLFDRQTRKRAEISSEGNLLTLLKESYHGLYIDKLKDYLVFYEFGYDFVEELDKMFKVSMYSHNDYGSDVLTVFACARRNG